MSYYFTREIIYVLYYYPDRNGTDREIISEHKETDVLCRKAYTHSRKHHAPRMGKVALHTLMQTKECYQDNAKYLIELKK